MDAWILDESPGTYRWGSIDLPALRDDDVQIRVVTSALNHMDLWVTRGMPKPPLPHVPGCDVAGVVEAVGDDVTSVAVGDEVVINPGVSPVADIVALGNDSPMGPGFSIYGEHDWGGHATFAVAPERNVFRRPAGRTWVEAAAYPLATLTAYRMLRRARLEAGQTVLVVGIGSGVSCAALAIARHLGAEVVATSRSEAKQAAALTMGASAVVDSAAERWAVQADIVIESVGAATWERVAACAEAGRSHRGVRWHVWRHRHDQSASPVLQAARDHRLVDGQLPGVLRGDEADGERVAGARRPGLPARRATRTRSLAWKRVSSSARSCSSTDFSVAGRRSSGLPDDDNNVGMTPLVEPDPGLGLLDLYDEALPRVYGYLVSRCGDRTLAEDLTAESFTAAVAALRKPDAPTLSIPWLIGVARHKLVDHWRRREREDRGLRLTHDSERDSDDPWEDVLDEVRARSALELLGAHHRAALTLRYLDGLPVAAVAECVGRSVHATEALLVRARRAFRHAYTQGEGES